MAHVGQHYQLILTGAWVKKNRANRSELSTSTLLILQLDMPHVHGVGTDKVTHMEHFGTLHIFHDSGQQTITFYINNLKYKLL